MNTGLDFPVCRTGRATSFTVPSTCEPLWSFIYNKVGEKCPHEQVINTESQLYKGAHTGEGEMCGAQEEEQHLGKASIQKTATYCPKGTPHFSLGPSAQLQAEARTCWRHHSQMASVLGEYFSSEGNNSPKQTTIILLFYVSLVSIS